MAKEGQAGFATLASLVKRGPLTREELYPPKAPKAKPHLAALATKHELKYLDQRSQGYNELPEAKAAETAEAQEKQAGRPAKKGVEEEWWSAQAVGAEGQF